MASKKDRKLVKGKRLDRLCEKLAALRPDIDINSKKAEWQSIKDLDSRYSRVSVFLHMNGVNEQQIDAIKKYAATIPLPWKKIIKAAAGIIALAIVLFLVYKWFEFRDHPRVYTFGNNVQVYTDPSFTTGKDIQLDIFGQSFGSAAKQSVSSVLLIDTNSSFVKVKKDNFFDYLNWNASPGFVKKEEVVLSKGEYDQYTKIFEPVKGDSNLANVDNRLRKALFDLINTTPSLNNSVLANDYTPRNGLTGFSKILSITIGNDASYLFMRLKTAVSARNVVLIYTPDGKLELKDLMENNGQPVNGPGLFRKVQLKDMPVPDIIYLNTEALKEWKSIMPPYNAFNPNPK